MFSSTYWACEIWSNLRHKRNADSELKVLNFTFATFIVRAIIVDLSTIVLEVEINNFEYNLNFHWLAQCSFVREHSSHGWYGKPRRAVMAGPCFCGWSCAFSDLNLFGKSTFIFKTYYEKKKDKLGKNCCGY